MLTAGLGSISRLAFLVDGVSAPSAFESNAQDLAIAPQTLAPAAGERVKIRLEVLDSVTETPITSITPGSEFALRAFVTDLRTNPQGVFSAYVDVLYEANLAHSEATIGDGVSNENPYTTGPSGDARVAGLVDEAGGITNSISPLGGGEKMLFTVLLRADEAGTLHFTLDPADVDLNDILLYDDEEVPVPMSEVEFVNTTLIVGTPQPTMSISDVIIVEKDNEPAIAELTVTLSEPTSQIVSFNYTTGGGTATADVDFETPVPAGSDFFPLNQTTRTISIPVFPDELAESGETFFVTLSNVTNATIAGAVGRVLIIDDDSPPATISINDPSTQEGNSGTLELVFNVALSNAVATPVTVGFSTAPGTAVEGTDYQSATGTVTFAAGETIKTVSVSIVGDAAIEDTETFTVNLANSSGPEIAKNQGTGTILNDDVAPPVVSIEDVTQNEGSTGITDFVFTVKLDHASTGPVTVQATTAADTATTDSDFTPDSRTITFAAGVTEETFTVRVNGDTVVEGDEQFLVNLTSVTGATLGDAQAVGKIVNDDVTPAMPTLAINDMAVVEGDSGVADLVFTVTRTGPSDGAVSVNFATEAGTATTATDFEANSGILNLAAGENSITVTIRVIGDEVDDDGETFFVNLTNATGATIADAQGVGTITDDDDPPLPTLSISDVPLAEGNSGETDFEFTVTLSPAATTPVTVVFNTTAGTALAGEDFVANTGTLTFAVGETSQKIVIKVVGDATFEQNENFTVGLANATGATIAKASGLGTINNDDDQGPAFSVGDITVAEGDSGTTNATFTVTLSEALTTQATVNFATANGSALAPGDYTSNSGTLTFAAGETTKTVTVAVAGDVRDEVDETFRLLLSEAVGAAIADAEGVATITDLDPTPTLTIENREVPESNTVRGMVFTVTLSKASGRTVTVKYATSDGTAKAGEDFVAASGTLTFAAGDTTKTINLTIPVDSLDEANEKFTVTLTEPSGATLADGVAEGTITDNDPEPSLTIGDLTVVEGDDGTKEANFVVTLSAVSGLPVVVDFATAAGTALANSDFQPANGTLTFLAGDSTKTVTVRIVNDLIAEGAETFTVNLSNASFATIADASATATITDNEPVPAISIGNVSLTEGDSGTQNAVFTVTLSGASSKNVTVAFATANGTAVAGTDYTANSGTLTFAPGETSKTVTVVVTGDEFAEIDETFFVNLTNPTEATIATAQGTATLINTDEGPIESEACSVAGSVYVDVNQNGVHDAGELGLANIPIRLTGTDKFGNPVDRATTTNAAGDYFFAGIVPGEYILTETHPAEYLDGQDIVGSTGGTTAGDQFFFSLGAAQNGAGYNFGEAGLGLGGISRRNFIVPR